MESRDDLSYGLTRVSTLPRIPRIVVVVNFLVNNLTKPPGSADISWTNRVTDQHQRDEKAATGRSLAIS